MDTMLKFIKHKYNNLISDTKFSEILSGSVWVLSAQILAAALGLISSIIIARLYGVELLGIVAVLDSFLILATIFTVLGTNISILRLIPEHLVKYSPTSAFRLYRKSQYMAIGVSVMSGTLFFLGSNMIADKLFTKPHLSFYFSLAAGFVVFRSLMLLNTQAVRSLKLMRAFAFMEVLPYAVNLILLILLGIFLNTRNVPVYAFLIGFALTGMMGLIIVENAFKKRILPNDPVHPMPVKDILSISLPMLMTAAMYFVLGQTGVIMLGIFNSEAEVGYYAAAVKLATSTMFVLQAVNSIAAPKFSELFHSGNIDELFHVAKKSAKLIFWATTPICIGLMVFGRPMLTIMFGHDFAVGYPALLFLVLGQFVNAVSGATGLFMNMTGNQKVFKNILLITAMANIGFNLFFIPRLGIHGAALSGMVSLALWNIITLIYIKSKFGMTIGYLPGMSLLKKPR